MRLYIVHSDLIRLVHYKLWLCVWIFLIFVGINTNSVFTACWLWISIQDHEGFWKVIEYSSYWWICHDWALFLNKIIILYDTRLADCDMQESSHAYV